MQENLRIGYVAGHCCIRVQKMALPLMQKGHVIHMLSQRIPGFVSSFDSFCMVHSIHQLRNCVRMIEPHVDLFHCHNEPSWFVTLIKEETQKPVVLDVHDSFLARVTDDEWAEANDNGEELLRISIEERNNFQLADALVFPSEPFADLVCKEFMLTQPVCILPSYLPQNLYAYGIPLDWLGGLVYEGRVDLKSENHKNKKHQKGFAYTDYEEIAKSCKDIDMDLHLYARDDKPFHDVYKNLAVTHRCLPYQELIGALARHDWGLVGNSFYTPEWEIALPNKLWEYVAAGTPVVSINAKHCSETIEKHGIGITVKSIKELADRWKEHTDIRRNLLKVRGQFVMEKHIDTLEKLYFEVLGETA